MLNVYDILINLMDSNRVYESFEWSSKDNVEHIKKMPMVKISSDKFKDFIYNYIQIDKDFLEDIYKKSEVYNGDKISVIDYGCLFTDGNKVLSIEFNKDGKSLFKSFLLLDEEEEILDVSNELSIKDIKYKVIKKIKVVDFLTREEEFRMNYLLKELKYAKEKKNYEKINYLYEEIYPNDNKTNDEKYKILTSDILNNYSLNHNELFKILKLTHQKKKTTSN